MTVVVVSWILVLLAVFGFNQTRDVIAESRAVDRGIERHRVRACARSGVEFARQVLENTPPEARRRLTRSDAENPLAGIHACGSGRFVVGVHRFDGWAETWTCGLQDEGARLPVTIADAAGLARLRGLSDSATNAILDAVETAGANRMAPLEALGLDGPSLASATMYLSRYGTTVNVNTASKEVLRAVGVPRRAAEHFLAWRAGPDRIEGTADDRELGQVDELFEPGHECRLSRDEAVTISYLQATGRLSTHSDHFRLIARGWIPGEHAICEIEVVLELRDDAPPRIAELTEHWRR